MKSSSLADRDVSTKRRRIVILEVLEVQAPGRTELISHPLTGGTAEGGNHVAVARCDAGGSEVAFDSRRRAIGRRFGGRRLQLRNLDATGTGQGVVRCLQLVLARQQEDQRARLSRIRSWDVEVDYRRDGGRDDAIVTRAASLGRLGFVDRDDEMRVFVLTGEVGRATARAGTRSSGRRWGRRRSGGSYGKDGWG